MLMAKRLPEVIDMFANERKAGGSFGSGGSDHFVEAIFEHDRGAEVDQLDADFAGCFAQYVFRDGEFAASVGGGQWCWGILICYLVPGQIIEVVVSCFTELIEQVVEGFALK